MISIFAFIIIAAAVYGVIQAIASEMIDGLMELVKTKCQHFSK
jgi:hypothetical protein